MHERFGEAAELVGFVGEDFGDQLLEVFEQAAANIEATTERCG